MRNARNVGVVVLSTFAWCFCALIPLSGHSEEGTDIGDGRPRAAATGNGALAFVTGDQRIHWIGKNGSWIQLSPSETKTHHPADVCFWKGSWYVATMTGLLVLRNETLEAVGKDKANRIQIEKIGLLPAGVRCTACVSGEEGVYVAAERGVVKIDGKNNASFFAVLPFNLDHVAVKSRDGKDEILFAASGNGLLVGLECATGKVISCRQFPPINKLRLFGGKLYVCTQEGLFVDGKQILEKVRRVHDVLEVGDKLIVAGQGYHLEICNLENGKTERLIDDRTSRLANAVVLARGVEDRIWALTLPLSPIASAKSKLWCVRKKEVLSPTFGPVKVKSTVSDREPTWIGDIIPVAGDVEAWKRYLKAYSKSDAVAFRLLGPRGDWSRLDNNMNGMSDQHRCDTTFYIAGYDGYQGNANPLQGQESEHWMYLLKQLERADGVDYLRIFRTRKEFDNDPDHPRIFYTNKHVTAYLDDHGEVFGSRYDGPNIYGYTDDEMVDNRPERYALVGMYASPQEAFHDYLAEFWDDKGKLVARRFIGTTTRFDPRKLGGTARPYGSVRLPNLGYGQHAVLSLPPRSSNSYGLNTRITIFGLKRNGSHNTRLRGFWILHFMDWPSARHKRIWKDYVEGDHLKQAIVRMSGEYALYRSFDAFHLCVPAIREVLKGEKFECFEDFAWGMYVWSRFFYLLSAEDDALFLKKVKKSRLAGLLKAQDQELLIGVMYSLSAENGLVGRQFRDEVAYELRDVDFKKILKHQYNFLRGTWTDLLPIVVEPEKYKKFVAQCEAQLDELVKNSDEYDMLTRRNKMLSLLVSVVSKNIPNAECARVVVGFLRKHMQLFQMVDDLPYYETAQLIVKHYGAGEKKTPKGKRRKKR